MWTLASSSRPSQLSSIKAELAAARNNSNEVSFPELVQLISKFENSHKRKNGTLKREDDNKLVSNRTAIGCAKAHQLERGTMQPTQDARVKACKSKKSINVLYVVSH